MLERPRFTIETVADGENYGRYRVEPLEPGYGTTLGNALRRILLRSLEGVAISRVRIDGVWHEFSTVKDVREDVTELVLNLKKVRLRRVMDINGDVRAHLYVRGDGAGDKVVTAGDVAWPTEVDVINPDQAIATLTAPDAVLDVDLWVNRGRGYREADAQETFALGEIPIDAIYTPIQKVNYVVEHTRVGQQTDYDSLILEILTDGTIEPDDALSEAAQILVEHARVFAEFNREPAATETVAGPSIPEEVQNTRLTDLGLSPRVTNALRSRGIETVGHVLSIDADTLMSIRNFGPRSLNELRDKLIEYGYWPEDSQLGAVEAEAESDDEDLDDMAAALRALQERGIGGDLDDEE
ncbi:MAG: DNA-directed RNA polymerase subunit alpha [Thermomicrobiales bacterium]|nr:DNA-directed RNA polymerase subunit alpha [Thermomicrobiales bacterium]